MTLSVSHRPRTTRILAVLVASLLLPIVGVMPAAADDGHSSGPLAGLRILMTNDDSMQAARPNQSDGLGLYEVRRALCAAGADVVVMAPWQVQSGRGTAVSNSGVFQAQRRVQLPPGYEADCATAESGGAVFGVCLSETPCDATSASATPVDTVKFALRAGLAAKVGWADGPDLVVTGANSGLNVSSSVNDSGTLGAAVAAIESHVPAIAFSSSFDSTFQFFPLENYRATAEWGAEFIAGLRERGLLDQRKFAVSVNFPDVSTGEPPNPPVFVRVGTGAVAYHRYVQEGPDTFRIALGTCSGSEECIETRRDSDAVAAIQHRNIAVGAITWDRSYGTKIDGRRELASLERFVERDAPGS